MWSKQQTEAGNKNMTSLKDKITHRKRKGNKSKNAQPVDSNSTNANGESNKKAGKQQQNNLHKSNNKKATYNKNTPKRDDSHSANEFADVEYNVTVNGAVESNLIDDLIDSKRVDTTYNKDDVKPLTNNTDDKIARLDADSETDGIILRNQAKNSGINLIEDRRISDLNNSLKRYSDSFVIARNSESKDNCNDGKLSRAQSGFFVTDTTESCDFIKADKTGRKSRRFSDIFRYGTLRTSSSCDNFNIDDMMLVETGENGEMTEVTLRNKPRVNDVETEDPNKTKKGKKYNSDAKTSSRDSAAKIKTKSIQKNEADKKVKVINNTVNNSANNSYLKRVKSKIYKPKSENTSALPSMPQISENSKNKKNKTKKVENKPKEPPTEMRNSVSHFDFRLLRQTSNLERIRPQGLGPKKSTSNVGINDLLDNTPHIMDNVSNKPVLAKSKSSSAINLNLLRTRRSKLLEQVKKNCKIAQDEFDFIAFGGMHNTGVQFSRKFGSQNLTSSINNTASTRPSSWLHNSTGDTKPGHPVTRTGSDRRPDAVREESSKTQDSSNHTPDNEDDTSTPDTSKSLPATTTHKRRNTSNINRSESVKEQPEKRKQRRNISDPLHNNTSESVDIDNQGLSYQTHSGSSSNTSISSSRSSNDSPSSSLDTVSTFHVGPSAGTGWESESDIEGDPPDWQSSLTEEELNRLQPYEKKRQDVINEVFQTERSHLRNLRVLEKIFFKPIHANKHLKTEEINLVFSNLSELVEIHSQFNMMLKSKKKDGVIVKEVGDILTTMFDGNLGDTFQRAAATFCERQQLALEFIKEKRRRDTKFDSTLNELEKNIYCRRLPLQSFIPMEMQRLSKYPLLLERLIDIVEKNVENDPDYSQAELSRLQQAHDRSKIILNHVNEAAKQAVNKARLEEIQNHLDTSQFDRYEVPIVNEFKNLDITKYNLIHEGPIQLKRQNKVNLQVHMVLLEEVVILLQREGDRYVLKFFQTGIIGQTPLSPIIKMSTLLVRTNAALKSSLFLVNTSTQNSQMYELLARDSSERKTWFKHLSDAAEAYNKREGKSKRPEPTPDTEEETLHELPSAREAGERAESVGGVESTSNETENNLQSAENSQRNSDAIEDERDKRLSQSDSESNTPSTTPLINPPTGGGVSMKFAADDWPLIQPSEVQVEVAPVHTAEPVLTPIEQIKRKGEEVRQALEDKEKLVADLLSIPRDQYHYIADMASEDTRIRDPSDREPTELVLAAVYQADQLLAVVNESLSISEVESVLVTGGKHPSCASNEALVSKNHMPSVPVHRLQDIATTLSSQLTTLLSVIKHRDEERDRLRKELQRTREQLHEKLSVHGSQYSDIDDNTTHLDSTQSGDLESIEESPTENEST